MALNSPGFAGAGGQQLQIRRGPKVITAGGANGPLGVRRERDRTALTKTNGLGAVCSAKVYGHFLTAALPRLCEKHQTPVAREIGDPRGVEPRQIALNDAGTARDQDSARSEERRVGTKWRS